MHREVQGSVRVIEAGGGGGVGSGGSRVVLVVSRTADTRMLLLLLSRTTSTRTLGESLNALISAGLSEARRSGQWRAQSDE